MIHTSEERFRAPLLIVNTVNIQYNKLESQSSLITFQIHLTAVPFKNVLIVEKIASKCKCTCLFLLLTPTRLSELLPSVQHKYMAPGGCQSTTFSFNMDWL